MKFNKAIKLKTILFIIGILCLLTNTSYSLSVYRDSLRVPFRQYDNIGILMNRRDKEDVKSQIVSLIKCGEIINQGQAIKFSESISDFDTKAPRSCL